MLIVAFHGKVWEVGAVLEVWKVLCCLGLLSFKDFPDLLDFLNFLDLNE